MIDMEDALGCFGLLFVAGLALFVALVIGSLVIDTVQERRAFPALAACKAKRMEPLRQSLSTAVVCTPLTTRQDTTTVQVR